MSTKSARRPFQDDLRVRLLKKIIFKKEQELELIAMAQMFAAEYRPMLEEIEAQKSGNNQQSRGQKRKYQDVLQSPKKRQRQN